MKPGYKLLILSISCLTLASGCTKKNTNKDAKAKPAEKVEAKDAKKDTPPVTGPIKEDPKPGATGGETSGAAPVSTPTPADEAKGNPAASSDSSAAGTSSRGGSTATVTQPGVSITQSNTKKTELELFEECISPKISSAISKERDKDTKTIAAKKLFETKLAILKDCPKPAAKADEAEASINKKIAEYTLSKFSDVDEIVDTFMGIEGEKASESERAKLYDQVAAEAAALAAAPNQTSAAPSVQPIATPQLQPTPAVVATTPAAVAVKPADKAASSAAPKATDKAAAAPTVTTNKVATGTPVASAPVVNTVAPAAKPAVTGANDDKKKDKKESEVYTTFKGCFTELVNKGLGGMKSAKAKAATPHELLELKLAAAAMCGRSSIKENTVELFMTQTVVDVATKSFPDSAAEIKFFAETEAKNENLKTRRQAYSAYGKPKDSNKAAVKPVAQAASAAPIPKDKTASATVQPTTAPIELKDLPSFEKCINETSDTLIKLSKEKTSDISSPYQLTVLKNILLTQCKISATAETNATLHKTLNEKVKANYPKSGAVLDFYNVVTASTYQDELKEILIRYYGLASEFKFLNTKLTGAINRSQTSGGIVTYSLKQIAGEIQSTVGVDGKEPFTSRMPLSEEPIENVNFVFDLNLKANNVGTLTIIEGQESFPLEFTFVNGDSLQLIAKQNVTIAFSNESWSRVLESKLRHTVGIPKHLVPIFPFKYSIENQTSQTLRTCELTATDMKCTDPNSVIKFKLNKDSLVLPSKANDKLSTLDVNAIRKQVESHLSVGRYDM